MTRGIEVNKARLSEILGYSQRSLTTWQKLGMPVVGKGVRGSSHRYNTAEVIAWMIRRTEGHGAPRGLSVLLDESGGGHFQQCPICGHQVTGASG